MQNLLRNYFSWVVPFIQKLSLRRSPATIQERLCVTLRYLCTGDSQITIGTSYKISPNKEGSFRKPIKQYSMFLTKKNSLKRQPQRKSG